MQSNPFHPTTTPSHGVWLSFDNITLDVPLSGGKGTKRLLHGISGQVPPGSLLAVMGPSGAAKTSLLRVLTQQIREGVGGTIRVNGELIDSCGGSVKLGRLRGFVSQETPLFDTLTVRETLTYAAALRLPKEVSKEARDARIDALLRDLDLQGCANTFVGKPDVPGGISGGEKRRLATGIELIANPFLLCADEVTSGLDSTSALRLIRIFKRLAAQQGRTVIVTLHQPRANIMELFDQLLVLAGGRTVYYGPTFSLGRHEGEEDGMLRYFSNSGYPFDVYENPADALMDLINTTDNADEADSDTPNSTTLVVRSPLAEAQAVEVSDSSPMSVSSVHGMRKGKDRAAIVSDLVQKWAASQLAMQCTATPAAYPPVPAAVFSSTQRYPTSFWRQVSIIGARSFMFKLRCADAVISQFVTSVVMSIVVGSVFWRLDQSQAAARDRVAAISFFILTQSFIAFDQVVTFALERSVYLRETAAGIVSSSSFYIGRSLSELPSIFLFAVIAAIVTYFMFGLQLEAARLGIYVLVIVLVTNAGASLLLAVGAMSSSMAMGNAVATLCLVFASLFNGFFIQESNIPAAYQWINKLSFPRWGVSVAAKNELSGLSLTCTPEEQAVGCIADGDTLLLGMGMADVDIWATCGWLLLESIVFRILGFLFLHFLYTGQSFKERMRQLLHGA